MQPQATHLKVVHVDDLHVTYYQALKQAVLVDLNGSVLAQTPAEHGRVPMTAVFEMMVTAMTQPRHTPRGVEHIAIWDELSGTLSTSDGNEGVLEFPLQAAPEKGTSGWVLVDGVLEHPATGARVEARSKSFEDVLAEADAL